MFHWFSWIKIYVKKWLIIWIDWLYVLVLSLIFSHQGYLLLCTSLNYFVFDNELGLIWLLVWQIKAISSSTVCVSVCQSLDFPFIAIKNKLCFLTKSISFCVLVTDSFFRVTLNCEMDLNAIFFFCSAVVWHYVQVIGYCL